MYIFIYHYDTTTGFITSVVGAERDQNDPFLNTEGCLALTDYISATVTTSYADKPSISQDTQIHGGGFSFVLENSVPSKDENGNYLLTPPAWSVYRPSANDYAVLGMVKSRALDPNKDLDEGYVVGLNRALQSLGLPIMPETTAVALPVRTCVTNSANLAPVW